MGDNPGMKIWKNKKAKRTAQANQKKIAQIGLCRFIQITWDEYNRINGKTKHAGRKTAIGLQLEHNFYYLEAEKIKLKKVNARGCRIKELEGVPDNLPAAILDMYNKHNG